MSINHAHLRAFNAVAIQGSYTKAAEVLHVTQPTLSAHVKELEQRYSVKLFDRRGRGIALTRTGRLRVNADAPYHIIPVGKMIKSACSR